MLVLTRKRNEKIVIGETIEVTILAVQGGQVKVGISAPRGVSVHRDEVLRRIRREEARASVPGAGRRCDPPVPAGSPVGAALS